MNPSCTALADVTVNVSVFVPPVPSVTVGLLIVNVSTSSLLIVPVPTAPVVMASLCVAVAADTVPSVTVNCSFASTIASVVISTEIVCVSFAVPANVSGLAVVTE